jgi:hypothetical protein
MSRLDKVRLGSVVALLCIGLIAIVLSSSSTTPALAAKPPRTPTPTAIPPATPTPTPTPTAPPDFALGTNRMSPWWTGYLVRGGLRKVDCPLCQSDFEPRYITFDYGECSYANNTIDVVSLNGFEGTITLEILNLPSGVTSRTATSIFLPRQYAASTGLLLDASTTSALGDATITIRGTSGSIVHTVDHFISIVDQMPPCNVLGP